MISSFSYDAILSLVCLAQNPSFDFSGAEFNGTVPDAHSFMGGIDKNAMR